MPYVKFLGVWLLALLVAAGLLAVMTGSRDTLSSKVRSDQVSLCDRTGDSVIEVSREDCLREKESVLRDIAEEAQGNIMIWHFTFGVVVLIVGAVFMFLIVSRDAEAGTQDQFESLKGTWFISLAGIVILMIIATFLARILDAFGKWAELLEPGLAWGIPGFVGLIWVIAFWAGTKIATPSKMQPSIPPG